MRRTLLEIVGFSAVILLFGTLHQRIDWLNGTSQEKDRELTELRLQLDDTRRMLAQRAEQPAGNRERLDGNQLRDMEKRLEDIAARVVQVTSSVGEARGGTAEVTNALTREVGRTREAILADVTEARKVLEAESRRLELRTKSIESDVQAQRSALDRLRGSLERDREAMMNRMLSPTVQLNGEETVGSGTVIYSKKAAKGDGFESYVITSYHVIRNIMNDPGHSKAKGIAVNIYGQEKTREDVADMVLSNEAIDAAILKLRGKERCTAIARIVSLDRLKDVSVFTGVYAVGCPLGNDPIPTGGFVASLTNKINGSNYWMINAPTYFGNSGGGIYLDDTYELVAVFSKIYTHGKTRPVVITHMGLATPMNLIVDWLRSEKQEFLLDAGRETDAARTDTTSAAAAPR